MGVEVKEHDDQAIRIRSPHHSLHGHRGGEFPIGGRKLKSNDRPLGETGFLRLPSPFHAERAEANHFPSPLDPAVILERDVPNDRHPRGSATIFYRGDPSGGSLPVHALSSPAGQGSAGDAVEIPPENRLDQILERPLLEGLSEDLK